ncbi:MAG: OadG family protein [Bacteroidales bacterium]|nr:OadG family protein [Bacteroidales bacterium]
MSNIGLGLELMVVGMTSVFLILVIVILLGKLMISVTNRFPVEQPSEKPAASAAAVGSETRSIIEAAVKELTGGKGTVKEIVKL